MPKTISLDYPNLGKGELVEIDGLGLFANGESYEVADDVVAMYESRGSDWPRGGKFTSETSEGPTLDTTNEPKHIEDEPRTRIPWMTDILTGEPEGEPNLDTEAGDVVNEPPTPSQVKRALKEQGEAAKGDE